jgi:hypothetical protein
MVVEVLYILRVFQQQALFQLQGLVFRIQSGRLNQAFGCPPVLDDQMGDDRKHAQCGGAIQERHP